jgi:hypothetical protein
MKKERQFLKQATGLTHIRSMLHNHYFFNACPLHHPSELLGANTFLEEKWNKGNIFLVMLEVAHVFSSTHVLLIQHNTNRV